MTSPTSYTCPLDVSAATLSAWRDGLLDAREAAQLQTHAHDCATCRARLAAFDRLGAMVRSGGDPNLRAPVWAGLRARILRGDRRSGVRGKKALWGGGIATVAAALLVALFLALFAGHGRHN
ncbi:MAG: anti-sigma factor family protein, partial [Ktedonobacterales bacterium]